MNTRRSVLRRVPSAPALTLALAISFAYLTPSVSAQVTSPVGSYGVLVTQWQNFNVDETSAFLGVLNFDGAGNISGTYTLETANYSVLTGALTGTYSGNPDGSNTVNLTLDFGATVTALMAVTDGGTGLQLLVTGGNVYQQGVVISGTGRIIPVPGTIPAGSYGYLLNRWIDNNNNPENDFGIFTLDGAGNVSGSNTSVYGGKTPISSGTLMGTYAVNPDSTGSLSLDLGGGVTWTFAIVVVDGGSGILMLQTNQPSRLNHVLTIIARMQ